MLRIYNALNVIEAGLIIAVLKEHDISAYWQNAAGNVIAHEIHGFGIYGIDIYVDDENAEIAKEILNLAIE